MRSWELLLAVGGNEDARVLVEVDEELYEIQAVRHEVECGHEAEDTDGTMVLIVGSES